MKESYVARDAPFWCRKRKWKSQQRRKSRRRQTKSSSVVLTVDGSYDGVVFSVDGNYDGRLRCDSGRRILPSTVIKTPSYVASTVTTTYDSVAIVAIVVSVDGHNDAAVCCVDGNNDGQLPCDSGRRCCRRRDLRRHRRLRRRKQRRTTPLR